MLGRSWGTVVCVLAVIACLIPSAASAKRPSLVAKPVHGAPPAVSLLGAIGKTVVYSGKGGWDGKLYASNGKRGGTKLIRRSTMPAETLAKAPGEAAEQRIPATAGGRIVFSSMDPEHGREWWATDGTKEGTKLLIDAIPGPDSSVGDYDIPVYLGPNRVVIPITDAEHGREWWLSDGTPEGTHLIKDINPGPYSSNSDFTLADRVAAGGLMYFTGKSGGQYGPEQLWRTDGTGAGTFSLGVPMTPGGLHGGAVGGSFFFQGGPSAGADEIWVTDGTVAATRPYYDFPQGWPGINGFTTAGNRLFISWNSILWLVTDPGSPPVQLHDFGATRNGLSGIQNNPDNRSSYGEAFGDDLHFLVLGGEPTTGITTSGWISQGTPETTRPLTPLDGDCPADPYCSDGTNLYLSKARKNRTVLKASDGSPKTARKIDSNGKPVQFDSDEIVRAAGRTYFIYSFQYASQYVLWKISPRR